MTNNPNQKRWCDMTDAEKAKERARIQKAIKAQEKTFRKSGAGQWLTAHTDKRERTPNGPEMNAAMWALGQKKGLPAWIASRIQPNTPRFVGMDEYVIRRLLEGDAGFFRKLADAMDYLADVKAIPTEGGAIIPTQRTVKTAILEHWEQWEKDGDKIERRLAILKEQGYKISPQRYHKLVKDIGLK